MLKNTRISCLILTIAVIILGIMSRKMAGVPMFFGDMLYAVMIYFGIRMLFINLKIKKTAILSVVFCFCIEFLQLYRAEWMLAIRRSTLGHYALGEGFLWSDLIYYTLGVLIAFRIDPTWGKRN